MAQVHDILDSEALSKEYLAQAMVIESQSSIIYWYLDP